MAAVGALHLPMQVAMKLLGLLSGAICVVLTYRVSSRIFGLEVGAFASLLNPLLIPDEAAHDSEIMSPTITG